MNSNPTDVMIHSVYLCNSSHLDVNDISPTITTWTEDVIGNTKNWNLIFPNVTLSTRRALVINLCHGLTVSWEANNLRHASTKSYQLNHNLNSSSSGNCTVKKKH